MTTSKQCFCDREGLGDPNESCGDCPTRDYNTPEQHSLPVQRMATRAGSDLYAQGWNDALSVLEDATGLTNTTLETIKDVMVYFKTLCQVEPGQHGQWIEDDETALDAVCKVLDMQYLRQRMAQRDQAIPVNPEDL